MASDLPDSFAVESGHIKRFHGEVWRDDGEWFMESTVSFPGIGPMVKHAARVITAEHAAHVYDNYAVVREGDD